MARGKFSGYRQRHLARVLAIAGPKGLTELLDIVGGERRSLERSLESLEGQDLVTRVDTGQAPAPGRPSGLWSLTDAGRAASPIPADLGQLTEGRRCMSASFPPAAAAPIDELLEAGDLIASVDWVMRFDGDARGYLFVFDRESGPQPIESLRRVLTALGARCSVGNVGVSQMTPEFISVLKTAAGAVERLAPPAS